MLFDTVHLYPNNYFHKLDESVSDINDGLDCNCNCMGDSYQLMTIDSWKMFVFYLHFKMKSRESWEPIKRGRHQTLKFIHTAEQERAAVTYKCLVLTWKSQQSSWSSPSFWLAVLFKRATVSRRAEEHLARNGRCRYVLKAEKQTNGGKAGRSFFFFHFWGTNKSRAFVENCFGRNSLR